MLTIKRTCSIKIISLALSYVNRPLLALLKADADDCQLVDNEAQLLAKLDTDPALYIIYNQHVDAVTLVDNLQLPDSQVYIQIRQDTKGVLGLHAIQKIMNRSQTLELIFQ